MFGYELICTAAQRRSDLDYFATVGDPERAIPAGLHPLPQVGEEIR